MKFDVIIGNPPYNVGGDNSFYVKFINKSKTMLKEDSYFSFIIPNRFLDPDSKCSKSLNPNINFQYIFPCLNKYFPNVSTNIGAYIGKYDTLLKDDICDYQFENEKGIDIVKWNINKPLPIQNTTLTGGIILDKVFSYQGNKMKTLSKNNTENFVYLDSAYTRFCHTKDKGGKKTLIARVNETNHDIIENGKGVYINMDSLEQAHLNAWFLSRSLLGRFCIYSFANAAQISTRNINRLPIINNIDKNDKQVFDLFNISEEEREYIKNILVNTKENS